MTALLAFLPCAVAVFAVLLMRLSSLTAAVLALLTASVLWGSGIFSPVNPGQWLHAIVDAAVLELLVGVVIILGLFFVEVSNRAGGLGALGAIVQALDLPTSRACVFITLGIGVTVESLTGYGVSMFVTLPLLLQIVSRSRAIVLALVGMSLMAWGALSVATLLGAEIADVPLQDLAWCIVMTSGPIAAVLPMACVLIAGRPSLADLVYAVGAGIALVTGIALTTLWIGVEVAGVGGGLAVMVFSAAGARPRVRLRQVLANPSLLPYGLLVLTVVLQKAGVSALVPVNARPVIDTGRVSFDVLGSPAIALGMVSLVCIALRIGPPRSGSDHALFRHVFLRSWRALLSIFFFLVTARLLIESGAITSAAGLLSGLGAVPALVVVTILGGFGAYATGSGVASNALFMPVAVTTGQNFDLDVLFAALQHSGASHVAMASMPVTAILLAALPDRVSGDEQIAMRAGLVLATVWLVFVIASGVAQIWLLR